jgi:membrane-bound lytic murein transglycosylase A
MRGAGVLAVLALALASGSCGRLIPPGQVQPPFTTPVIAPASPPANALTAGVRPGPTFAALGVGAADAAGALTSFRESCPRLIARQDSSGLTRREDWKPACAAAASWPAGEAQRFFAEQFETAQVGEGKAFATGYYEPQIAGSRTRMPGIEYPVYGVPTDLVRARPGDAPANPNGSQPVGRYDSSGTLVPYHDRAAIEDGALAGRGLEVAWVADPVELFFLQVQGSGRLRAPDGTVIRIGFAGQNGHPYTGIGSVMRQRGLVGPGTPYATSMQGLMQFIRENPDQGRAIMRENRSWVFFAVQTGDGPLGSLEVPVRARSSVATDPTYVPLGAPVWLDLDRNEADGMWIAQDIGGAIKGVNRFDTFWGAGEDARVMAGGMSARGAALIFVPKGTLNRLGVQ